MSTPFFGANTPSGSASSEKIQVVNKSWVVHHRQGVFPIFSTTMFTISQAFVLDYRAEEILQPLRPVYIVFRDEPFDGH
jgi:hypothetical protein